MRVYDTTQVNQGLYRNASSLRHFYRWNGIPDEPVRPPASSLNPFRPVSAQDFRDRPGAFFNEMERPAVQDEIHLLPVQAHLIQDCRLQIADVVRALDGF